MNKGINWHLRKKILERDSFFCQKCYLEDKTGKLLQIHHIRPIFQGEKGVINNLITLCKDCHYYAPNNLEEFEEYIKEQCTGTMTLLIKSINKVRDENPELFSQEQLRKVKNPLDNL